MLSTTTNVPLPQPTFQKDHLAKQRLYDILADLSSPRFAIRLSPDSSKLLSGLLHEPQWKSNRVETPTTSRRRRRADLSGRWRPIVTPRFQNDLEQFLLASCKARQQAESQSSSTRRKQTKDRACTSSWYRQLLLKAVGLQRETIRQFSDNAAGRDDDGDALELVASHPVGSWNRTLRVNSVNQLMDPRTGEPIHIRAYWSHYDHRTNDGDHGKRPTHVSVLWYPNDSLGNDDSDADATTTASPQWTTHRYLLPPPRNNNNNRDDENDDRNDDDEEEAILVCESTVHSPLSTDTASSSTTTVVWKFQRDN